MKREILSLPKWFVNCYDPVENAHKRSSPFTLPDAKAAMAEAKRLGFKNITIKSANGFFNISTRQTYHEPDPFSCCGSKFRHAPDCWAIGGNVDQPNQM